MTEVDKMDRKLLLMNIHALLENVVGWHFPGSTDQHTYGVIKMLGKLTLLLNYTYAVQSKDELNWANQATKLATDTVKRGDLTLPFSFNSRCELLLDGTP